MTVPVSSLSIVLPGAPSPLAGTGVTAPGGAASLFEGLLAGLLGDAGAAAVTPANPAVQDAPLKDELLLDAPQDAGLALLLATPAALPAPVVPTPASPDGEPPVSQGFQRRPVLATALPTLTEPSIPAVEAPADTGPTVDAPTAIPAQAAPVATSDTPPRQPERAPPWTVPATDVKARPDLPSTPTIDPARPDKAPAVAAPVQQAVAAPVTAATVIAATARAAEPTAPPVAAPVETESRRLAPTRGERRDAAAGRAPADPSARNTPVAQAALAALTDGDAAEAPDAGAAAETDVAPVEVADAAETRQPALPGEVRAQAATLAAAEAAVARSTPQTVAKLAADIVQKVDGQSTRFDIELNPHGLGKVDVAIEIDRDGKLTAAMSFDSPQSAADLRGRAGELRQALEQAGFDVSEGGLTFDTAGQGAGFGGRDAAQQQQDRAWNGRAFQRAQSGAEEADLALAAPTPTPGWTRSGVDIRI